MHKRRVGNWPCGIMCLEEKKKKKEESKQAGDMERMFWSEWREKGKGETGGEDGETEGGVVILGAG